MNCSTNTLMTKGLLVLFIIYSFTNITHASPITSFEEYRKLPDDFCVTTETVNKHYYTFFVDSHPNITFESDNTWSVLTKEICEPLDDVNRCGIYMLESVRKYPAPNPKCINCPYHLDTMWSSDINPSVDQSRNDVYTPMFGPCLNNAPSLRMPCLQHYALYPQTFFGRYFFSSQTPLSESLWDEWYGASPVRRNIPMHQFLDEGLSSSPYNAQNQFKPPSSYGLGKMAVEDYLNSISFIFNGNKSTNVPFTEAFKRPYSQSGSVEQWMKWAQYFCFPGCHKNSKYSLFRIRIDDIKGDPELSYLTLYINDTAPRVPACRPCPKYTASYNWDDYASVPMHPKTNILAEQCYPWFGAIPTVVLLGDTYIMNSTYKYWNIATDKVVYPAYDDIADMVVCPVNTYNRVCGHTKAAIYNSAYSFSPPSQAMLNSYACTPCPPGGGYHTAGKEGQWYCHPPAGKLFLKRDLLRQDQQVWGDREKMLGENYPEMECGPNVENCRQCADYNRAELTPEMFNEEYIFSKLLAETLCPERFYCPDPFTQLQCPIDFPWSPIGSWHVSNCTCTKGRYFNGSVCLPCTLSCNVAGYYLPISKCIEKNGAIEDAPCTPCDNLPESRAIPDSFGTEYMPGHGTCPFHCILGSEMYATNTSRGACEKRFSCKIPTARVNQNGNYVYRENLDFDSLISNCRVQPSFSQQLLRIAEWQVQPSSCIGMCISSTKICYAQNQTNPFLIDANIPWYSFAKSLKCESCPDLPELPSQAYLQMMNIDDLRIGINFCQNPSIVCQPLLGDIYYFNKTDWRCQSCTLREQAICPPLFKLRGGGCSNSDAPFNQTHPSADCLACPIPVPDFNTSKGRYYLNYMNSSVEGGCSIDACLPLANEYYYWKDPCGGAYKGKQAPCTTDCNPAFQFRKARCSPYLDLICQNCTIINPGFQNVSKCLLDSDTVWKACDVGYYCDSSGGVNKCPDNRTTMAGADDISDCFCKVGMMEDQINRICVPMRCSDTTVNPYLPGKSLNSSHYMTLDPATMSTTKCSPCNTPGGSQKAYTRGNGLEIDSCVCPRGFYGVYRDSVDKTSIQCTPCSSPSCGTNRQPVSCLDGDLKLIPGQQFPCTCTITPFSNPITSTCTSQGCISGFALTNNLRTIRSGSHPRLSGSSLYAVNDPSSSSWIKFLESTGYSSLNNSVKSIAVTGCMDDSVLGNEPGNANPQAYHYEYIFWIVADPEIPSVFSALLQESSQYSTPTSYLLNNPSLWQVFAGNSLHYTDVLIGVAVSKWNTREPYYSSNENARDPWVYVAVLVRSNNKDEGLFDMKARVFNTSQSKNSGEWENNVYSIDLFPDTFTATNAIPVSISHSTKKLGEMGVGSEGGYFFTAFNTWEETQNNLNCGGIVIASPLIPTPSLVTSFCNGRSVKITSMALTLSQESSLLVALVSLSSGIVLKVESSPQTDPPQFFQSLSTSTSFSSMNMIVLFSLDSPIYISGMFSESLCNGNNFDGSYCLKTADTSQLSWVDIQNLPWGTSPTMQPVSIAASVMSRGKALLVVTRDSSIFTIPLYRCPSPTQYWDGVGCIEHTCLRQASCTAPMMPTIDGTGCVCSGGYYLNPITKTTCKACAIPNYCSGGANLVCPYGTMTTINTASSINDCICSIAGMFFNDRKDQPQCIECKSNDIWCPNRWQSFSCPGIFTMSLASSPYPIVYPTKCACAPGYTGANCELCPNGFYCPSSASTVAMNTAAFYSFSQPPLTNLVLGYINAFFLSYFNQAGTKLPSFATQADLSKILYTQVIPATNRTQYGIMIMIQIDMAGSSLTSSYDNFKRWHAPLFEYLKTYKAISVMPSIAATADINIVQANKPVQCIASKVPGTPPSSCICAAGYETNKEQCSACPATTFKASTGPGTCIACAVGTVSSIKATVCIADPALLTQRDIGSAPDTMLLVGGVGGGVVGLILLLFIIQGVIKRNHKE